ncbi:hypothetical protein [Chitinophaga sp. Cy-1792]|uniref:hypothetical protein n=1 Tax=Chitinophaga sp. Cy-1792 TaxID=2608339 RepID=UPI00141EEB5B|nr:hypothetical protein [Chitinophaga sp. Cy-1792]NIG56147.1 hypothetical protein [Chitinophaga sp. Cy-1792]
MIKYKGTLALVLTCFILTAARTTAQVPVVKLSNEFNVPGDGFDKLLQLRNGNTCYLHFGQKSGLEVSMYNPAHELLRHDTISPQQWSSTDLDNTEIDAIYQINGQPVIFLQQTVKDIPNLYRLVLDADNGRLLKEDKLGELPSLRLRNMYNQNNVASHDCFVEKDTRSDYYAVAFFNGAEIQYGDDTKQRITVQHYTPDHKLIHTGYFYMQDNTYEYFSYINMAVQDQSHIYMATVGFNGKRSSGESASKVVFSVLSPDSSTFSHHVLAYTRNYNQVAGLVKVVPAYKEVRLLIHVPDEKRSGNSGTILNIFSEDGKLRKHPVLTNPELSKNVAINLNYKDDYSGIPQNWIINDDGTSTIMWETLSFFKQGNNQLSNLHTNMGDAGVAELDSVGREDVTFSLNKYQVVTGVAQPFFQHRRSKSEWTFRNKIAALNLSPYVSYDFINKPDVTFMVFNDYLQYLDTGGADKTKKPLKFADDASFVCYRYTEKRIERLYLFGMPEVTKRYACILGASDYNAGSHTYATILLSRNGTVKTAALAWIEF